MYFEFLFIMLDYYRTHTKETFIYEFIVPFVVCLIFLSLEIYGYIDSYKFAKETIAFIGIILGFSLAALTIFTSDSKRTKELQDYEVKKKIDGVKISLYRTVVINFSYIILLSTVVSLVYYIFSMFKSSIYPYNIITNCVYVGVVLHLVLSLIRSTTNLYLILTRK